MVCQSLWIEVVLGTMGTFLAASHVKCEFFLTCYLAKISKTRVFERPACLFSRVNDVLLTVIKWSVWLEHGETINTCWYNHTTIVLILFHISGSIDISTLLTKHPKSNTNLARNTYSQTQTTLTFQHNLPIKPYKHTPMPCRIFILVQLFLSSTLQFSHN